LEFSDGTIIELARLHAGQRATVLQLPADEIPPANRRSVSEGSTELLAVKEV
jgi:hypothetical protein